MDNFSKEKYLHSINTAAQFIKSKINGSMPKLAIILGSGLGPIANEIENSVVMEYKDIPEFPVSTVPGHDGKLIYGTINGCPILAMKGRFHYYEGYDMTTVTFPVRVFASLGIKYLFVTNAAGGIRQDFRPGTIMIINDQINLFAPSVLRGPNLDEFGPRFCDMTEIYTKDLIVLAKKSAKELNIPVAEGVYSFYKGPNFETPADIRALKLLGADATGMSTVPEAMVARHSGLKVIGLSLITNQAAGISGNALNHEEVLEAGKAAEKSITKLAKEIIKEIYNYDTQLQ